MDDLLWARRWKRVLTYLKAGALAAVIVLMAAAIDTLHEMQKLEADVRAQLAQAPAVVASLNARLDHLQGKVDGSLQNVNAILLQAGLAADQARLASRDQREYARKFDAKLDETLAGVNKAVVSVTGDLHSTTEDVHATLVTLPELVRTLNESVQSIDKRVNDPVVSRTLEGLAGAAEQTAKTMAHVDAVTANVEKMSDDAQESFHKTMHPSRWQVARGSMLTGLKLLVSAKPW